jgi:hypothetical protein
MNRFAALVALGLAVVFPSAASAAPISAFQSATGGFFATSGSDQLYGWEFSVGSSIQVVRLGVGDQNSDGLAIAHDVGIFRVSDGQLLASATVPAGTSGILDNGFRYVDLGTSLLLTPGEYAIAMTMPQGNADLQLILANSVTTASPVTWVTSRFDAGSVLALPTLQGAFNDGMFGPNFQFQAAAAVPEPATLAVFGAVAAGAFGVRRRVRASA